jgi:hypothetical protein
MGRRKSAEIAERNGKMVAEVKATIEVGGTPNLSEVGDKYGVTSQMVKLILSSAGVEIKGKRGPKRKIDTDPISDLHYQIGRDISEYRFFKVGGRANDASADLGVSNIRLSMLEAGTYDPPLSELQRLAERMGVELHELVRLRGKDERRQVDGGTLPSSDEVQSSAPGEEA